MKVLIVEDHSLMREALGDLVKGLGPNVTVLEAGTADEALALTARTPDIDLLILDLLLPGQERNDPLQTLKAVRQRHARLRVVVYTAKPEREIAQRAIDLGARGYIPKWTDTPKIIEALQIVMKDLIYYPPEIFQGGDSGVAPSPPPPDGTDPLDAYKLTRRDRDVLKLLVQGESDKAIANACSIGVQNVKNRVGTLLERFEVKNRRHLMIKLWEMGVRLEQITKDKRSTGSAPGTEEFKGALDPAALPPKTTSTTRAQPGGKRRY